MGFLPLAAIISFLFLGNVGYGTLIWVVTAELLPPKVGLAPGENRPGQLALALSGKYSITNWLQLLEQFSPDLYVAHSSSCQRLCYVRLRNAARLLHPGHTRLSPA